MEHKRYGVDLEFKPRSGPVERHEVDPGDERRLSVFLPVGAEITESHGDPETGSVEAVVVLDALSPADALQQLSSSLEHLAINVRREHGMDPMGPMPELVQANIRHAPED
jgi:hypothetical protein